jgi:hypothetical protein
MPIEIEYTGPTSGTGAAPAAPSAPTEVVVNTAPPASTMPEAIRDRIAALQRGPAPKVEAPAVVAPPADKAPEPEAAKPAGDAPTEPVEDVQDGAADDGDKPSETPPPAPAWESERTELQGVTQRQRDIITKLEADLAETRKAMESTSSTRAQRIDEAEETYVRSPVAAVKKYIAAALGVEPDSEEHKKELLDLFVDLTEEISGATQDPAHQAKRVSALTRREWDLKEKRRAVGDNKQPEKTPLSEQEERFKAAIPVIQEGFKPIAEKHPHLAKLSQQLDKRPVESVLWEVIETGWKTGDFPRDMKDDVLVAKAAELAEQHYKRRWDEIRAAIPSTATPGVPPVKQDDKPAAVPGKTTQRQGNGRSLSNADASVAPSQTPPPQQMDKPPTFKNDAERARWATRHLRGEK